MLQINEEVRKQYGAVSFGTMMVRGVVLHDPPPEFQQAKREVERAVRDSFAGMDKKEMRNLFPFDRYHDYYRKFKKTYHVLHQCESLATGSRTIPAGIPLVQAMFMAEVKNRLLTAGYDCRNLQPPFQVALADGISSFSGISGKSCTPPAGDMIFASGQTILGSIICGPDLDHRIQATTTDVLFAVYGVPGIAAEDITRHLEDIEAFIRIFAPGVSRVGLSVV